MHSNSIQTQYYDQNDQIPISNFFNHSPQGGDLKKQMSSESSNVAYRIEQNIKEYQDQIKKNKDIINQLECQRKFFDKLSQKQKEKIEQTDIQKIRSSYETKIFTLKEQTSELHQIIATYHDQEQQAEESFLQSYKKISSNKQFLMQTLIELEKQNEKIASEVGQSQNELKSLEVEIVRNEKAIREKEAIHQKYVQLQVEIDKLQKSLNSPKKRG